jgi:tetratricopeptide (TPR) repeat protein
MPPEKKKPSKPEVKRRWRIPPPLLRDADSPGPEGLAILEEIQSEMGMVLWKTLRSTLIWAQATPETRGELFPDDLGERRQLEILAAVPEDLVEVREALESLTGIVGAPTRANPEEMGIACHRISVWAEGAKLPETSLEFLQAASLCCPADARFALAIGRAARDRAQYDRAESWLHRAVGLARQTRDWETYVWAYLGHGKMMLRRGALPAARRSYVKALRRSIRQGMRELEGYALQDLFILEDKAGNREESMRYARRAMEVLGPEHKGLPRLAHDVAVFWMQQGHFEHALPVLRESVDRIEDRCRGVTLGSVARAAGHLGEAEVFDWAVAELDRWWDGPGIADAWAEVARGAVALGRLDEARGAARRAETMARRRGESLVRFEAESLIESIQAEQRALSNRTTVEAVTPSEETDELARELLKSLQGQPAVS